MKNCSMTEMDFEENSFDIIWSEGAIYIMGFREGLENWKRFLKPGGYLVVSEASWLIDNPPEEILKFWEVEYPGMKRIDQNLEIVRNLNYKMIAEKSGLIFDARNAFEQRKIKGGNIVKL